MKIHPMAPLSLLPVLALWAVPPEPAPLPTGHAWGELDFASLPEDALPEAVAVPFAESADILEPEAWGVRLKTSNYRATLPDGLLLYVQWCELGITNRVAFLLHDPARNLASPTLLSWDSRWESDVQEVLRGVRITDLEGDGEWELVYRHKEHNGTMWNAHADHYLQLAPDLGLREEFQSLVSFTDLWSEHETGWMRIAVHPVSPHELELEFWLDNSGLGLPRDQVGSAMLRRESSVDSFELVERVVLQSRYEMFVASR